MKKTKQTTAPITTGDLITNIIQDQVNRAAKILKRSDLHICVMISPDSRPRYAIRLGDTRWIKDIDLTTTLDTITKPEDIVAKEAQDHMLTKAKAEAAIDLVETMREWKQVPVNPAFYEDRER
jgi:hypothetical protein